MMDYSAQLKTAEAAAREAGLFLKTNFFRSKEVASSSAHDLKLRLDTETQELIVARLRRDFPEYAVLGEEGSCGGDKNAPLWVIDPIDGTVNYFYGIPLYCVSIALSVNGSFVLGCVYDPMQDECFSACVGGPALLNGKAIRVSARTQMRDAVVFIGHGTHDKSGSAGVARFAHLSAQVKKIRILGTAALTLCYIAAGRFDAYVENRINLWDFSAARVILEAAGGSVEYTPSDAAPHSGAIIAWNGRIPIHQALQMP